MVCREKPRNVEKCRVLKIYDGLSNGVGWGCFGLGGAGGVLGWVEVLGGVLGWVEVLWAVSNR